LHVKKDFIETGKDLFSAEIYEEAFDKKTIKNINKWVSKNTDGMIPEIINEIPPEVLMYLINALAFEAEWQDIYTKDQIHDSSFTARDGNLQDAEMMYSTEGTYLLGENVQGFLKYYADKKYAFAALLPDESLSLEDYIRSLTGEELRRLLEESSDSIVHVSIPKFRTEYGTDLKEALSEMGMTDAFDFTLADFSGIASLPDGNLYISQVLHKTFIAVDEKGTKAGAATAVAVAGGAAMTDTKTVHLDRPFLYMIIDCEEKLPIFIGTVVTLE